MIPLVDLQAQHREVADEVARGFSRVLENTSFILGKDVEAFETAFATFMHTKYCVGVANGTDAIELLVRAAGIGPGDEVIVPANTFIATALGVARAGATPVFVDCDPVHHLIDPSAIEASIGPRTKAIMPVHLYGQIAPMEDIQAIATAKNLMILEDAAQAHGANRRGATPGSFGFGAGVSFYPGKNLGAYGDGGAVITDSEAVATRLRALRNYGSEVKYHHPELGFNSRLDTLQAVVLNAKLPLLAKWNDARRMAAQRYDSLLEGVSEVVLPRTLEGNDHVFHLYVIRVPRRDHVLKFLNQNGVGAGIHYPVPIHLQGAFKHLGHKAGDFPVTERAAAEILSLPLYPQLSSDAQEKVVSTLRQVLRSS